MGGIHPAEPYQSLLPLENAVQDWLDQPIGVVGSQAIPPEGKLEAALYGSQVAALFNQVQLTETGADFSCTSLGNDPVGLASPVTMRGVTAAYLFANTLVVLEVTEEVLRQTLERCAAYFTLVDGQPQISEEFLLPKVEHYNYDFYAGLSYTFDLRRPVGSRVIQPDETGRLPAGRTGPSACAPATTGPRARVDMRSCGSVPSCGVAAWKCRISPPATSRLTARCLSCITWRCG